jgi:uncharacterized repeat protein (TIGR01451 family)
VNVDGSRWEASKVRVCIFGSALLLVTAGCALLGWNSPFRLAGVSPSPLSSEANRVALAASPWNSPLSPNHSDDSHSKARSLFAGLPLIFEPNQGQANLDPSDARARFVAHGSGYSILLGSEGAILSLICPPSSRLAPGLGRVESFQMKIAGANPQVSLTSAEPLPGKSNYFLGNDSRKWRRGVPEFAQVRYENVYPGINLLFYGNQGRLEYDFQIAPGADPGRPELEFAGARRLEIKDGRLAIVGESGRVQFEIPRIYQEIAGHKQPVEGKFVLRGPNRVGFDVAGYDHGRELIIDPVLSFSTYFGGNGDELNSSIAVDGTFNIYLAGSTNSTNLPVTSGVYQSSLKGNPNVYIAKISPPLGSLPAQLQFVTYLGGSGSDTPIGIEVDGSGDPFVVGTTTSPDFPTTPTNAYQKSPESAGQHVFVTELNGGPNPTAASELRYSSYLSGNGTDIASGMTIDASGNVYVTGTTTSVSRTSDQFPASTLPQGLPLQSIPRAPTQFFVTKVNTNAPLTGSIAYSTYFGGGASQTSPAIVTGGGIAVDTSGNVYFTGTTNFTYTGCAGCGTTDFPILNPYQPCLDQPPPTTITTPPSCSTNASATAPDAFVAKLGLNVQQNQLILIWSTYLGGSGNDSGTGIALDSGAANVYLTGTTNSSDFILPSTTEAYQHCLDEPTVLPTATCTPLTGTVPTDAFVARFTNPTTSTTTPTDVSLNYFSYLGGSANDAGNAITVDSASGALVTGWTQSPDFPVGTTCGPIQCGFTAGSQEAFVARLNTVAITGQNQTTGSWASYFGGSATNVSGATPTTTGTSITLDVNQDTYFAGDTNTSGATTGIPVSKPLTSVQGGGYQGGYDAFVTQLGTAVSLSISGVLSLGSSQTYIGAGNQATFTYTITNTGPDLATNITLTDNLSPFVTGVPLTFNSASISAGTCGGSSSNGVVSCTLPSLESGSTATLTIVVTPTPNTTGSQATFNGGSVQAIGPGNIVLAQTSVPAQMSDFTIAVSPNNASVPAAGDTAVYGVQLTPHPVYGSPITLSCSGLPTGASCNFTNNSFALPGPSSSTLNLTTTVRPITTTAAQVFSLGSLDAIWLAFPGLAVVIAGVGRDRRRGLFLLCLAFAWLMLLSACSHTTTQPPTSGTPAGTYTITVTATSNGDTKSSAITLTVP